MKLYLPPKLSNPSKIELDCPCSVVALGSNGSGKSLFGKRLLALNLTKGMRIAALSGIYHYTEKEGVRTSDFDRLVQRVTDDYCVAATEWMQNGNGEKPTTLFDKAKRLWATIFPYNKLIFKDGRLHLEPEKSGEQAYPVRLMSDGEKVIFYLIASILFAPEEAILLIETPESYLHHSIKLKLWDELERCRKDCSFVYITHDIDFTSSRTAAHQLWIKGFDIEKSTFDYEQIENDDDLPEEVLFELLGSRKSVLFIEGDDMQSIDRKLYSAIFTNSIVKPLGGCQKVIETTKSFNEQKHFHLLQAKGIVDRDRRSAEEIAHLRGQQIYVPEVAEVENLLMLEDVIKTVARRMLKNENQIFEQVKENVINLFADEIEPQAILHSKNAIQKRLERALSLKLRKKEDLFEAVKQLQEKIDTEQVYQSIFDEFTRLAETKDYSGILRVYNQKGMLPQSKVVALCGLNNKNSYLQLVLDIINENKKEGNALSQTIKKVLLMEEA